MNSLQSLIATEHQADLHRAAARQRRVRTVTVPPSAAAAMVAAPTIDLRLAGPHEYELVERLVILDEATPLDGPVLLALVDGRPVAALSLADDRVVADPFVATREAVTLLRLRARHLAIASQGRRRRLGLHPRYV
jgi:hypothetical protein